MKRVSIVVINYNDKIRVQRAIDSALNQSYKNTEVIVVDDGSNEETRAMYKKYDDEIRLIQLEREDNTARTPSGARNAGFLECSGKYVMFLDSDNYIHSDFVKECMKTGSDVAFVNWEIVGREPYKVEIEKVWNQKVGVMQNYLQYTHLDHQCMLVKKELLGKLNPNGLPYDVRLPRSQDCDFIIGLMLLTEDWKHIPINLFTFEKHEVDQMKQYASIHGKTLWTLKRGLNIQWLAGIISRDSMLMLSFYQAINDFMNKEEWAEDYKKSEFKLYFEQFSSILSGERKEK